MIEKGSESVSSSISETCLVIAGGQNSLSKSQTRLWHFLAQKSPTAPFLVQGKVQNPQAKRQALLKRPVQAPFLTPSDAPSLPESFQVSEAKLLFPICRSLCNSFLASRPLYPDKLFLILLFPHFLIMKDPGLTKPHSFFLPHSYTTFSSFPPWHIGI